MAREDSGSLSDDDDPELEDATPPPASQSTSPSMTPQATPPTTMPLERLAKKKADKRRKQCEQHEQREQHKKTALASLSSTTPPAPTSRVLEKAALAEPFRVTFAANDFHASKPLRTGLTAPVAHPLLAHAHDSELLKKHLQYADWDGKKTRVIVDRCGRIIGVLIAPPLPGEDWEPVVQAATAAMRAARDKMTFPASVYHHRRAYGDGFPTGVHGFSFGCGRENISNIKASSAQNTTAMEELLEDPDIVRMATYPISLSPLSPPTLGPSLSPHPTRTPAGNKVDSMCLIGVLGNFDADKSGHLVCWDHDLIICFPPGCSILIPSAVVTHSNTTIQEGEERFSLLQYSAGGLFRWVANGVQSNRSWLTSASAEDLVRREEERKARCADALKKFMLWKDMKVKNFSGRARVEVWDSGDVANFSDLMDPESEGERPTKQTHRT
ncbi:hypothetical protein B0H14DRAFT_3424543 [Mycena olivaceomarginata]|nr:hypothetical protein B0H14DRAFT_3424543 [Mycena olivaceomarginata]